MNFHRIRGALVGGLVLCSSLLGCVTLDGSLGHAERARIARAFSPSRAQVSEAPADRGNQYAGRADAIDLGRHLFFFEGFTAPPGKPTSCASCHAPDKNFADDLPRGIGASGEPLARRSPSLYQTVNRHFLFWDGRTDSLWSQALAPIEDHNEMGSNRLRTLRAIAEHPKLRPMYEGVFGPLPTLPAQTDAYPCDETATAVRRVPTGVEQKALLVRSVAQNNDEPLPDELHPGKGGKIDKWCAAWRTLGTPEQEAIDRAYANVGKAIAAYEATIVSEQSPFDALLGKIARREAIAPDASFGADALRGLELFVSRQANCVACHSGPDLTDDRFHFLGIADHVPPPVNSVEQDPVAPALWVEGAFQVYENDFNCRQAAKYGQACSAEAVARLDAPLSVRTIVKLRAAQRRTAAQVRTPSLRNVAGNRFFMHDGSRPEIDSSLDPLTSAVAFYSTLPGGKVSVGVVKPGLKAKVGKRTRRLTLPTNFKKRIDRRARHIELSDEEIRHLTAFLRTLTGKPIAQELRTDPWSVAPGGPAPSNPDPNH